MENIEKNLLELKNKLESVAFLVSKGGSEKEAHTKIVQSLVIVSEIETNLSNTTENENNTKTDAHEINKVSRRLKLWAKRPDQENTKILNAYLKLKRAGGNSITESDLKNEVPEGSSFENNFAQMKIIAKKNHGKIFEQYGEEIVIWKPVLSDIRQYEKVVFGNIKT